MKTVRMNFRDMKADVYMYLYGARDKLEKKLRDKIAASLERQMALLLQIDHDEHGTIYEREFGPDVSHSGPTIELAEADFSRTEARILQHYAAERV